MNAATLIGRVSRRLPGYQQSEYLDEINDAYQEVWNYILQLDDSYFTDIQTVTVATQSNEFDFLYNTNGNLNASVSNRYFQIDRIRILQPGDTSWISAAPRNWNDPEYLNLAQLTPQIASTQPPYRYVLFSRGSVQFAQPLPVGAQIEVVYSFVFLPLNLVSNGTITNGSTTVLGTGTNFKSLVFPDYVGGLSGASDEDTEVGTELVLGGNQTYQVSGIVSDTQLTTILPVFPTLATATPYTLAMVPDIPQGHHDVIATVATRNVMSTPGNDSRLPYWTGRAKDQIDAMRDSIMSRQRQEPPRRRRFSQSVLRYSISSPGR